MAKKKEQIIKDLDALIEAGMGSETKRFQFETPISKLLKRPKYSINRKLPVASDISEAELICDAVGESLLDVTNKALSQLVRSIHVSLDQEVREAEEVKMIERAASATT